MDDYRKVDGKYKLHEVISPYTLAARTCVGKVGEWAGRLNIDENQIAFFFEDGSEDKTDLVRRMKREWEESSRVPDKESERGFSGCRYACL